MNIKIVNDKKRALDYLTHLPTDLLQLRFDPTVQKMDIKSLLENHTIFLCAIDPNTNETIGVLDAAPTKSLYDKKPLMELAAVTNIPGIGTKLFYEYRKLYPNTSTIVFVKSSHYPSIKIALKAMNIVAFADLYGFLASSDLLHDDYLRQLTLIKHPFNKDIPYHLFSPIDFISLEKELFKQMLIYLKLPNDQFKIMIDHFDNKTLSDYENYTRLLTQTIL